MAAISCSVIRIYIIFCLIYGTSLAFRIHQQTFAIRGSTQTFQRHSAAATKLHMSEVVSVYEELQIPTLLGIYLVDITADIRRIVAASEVDNGVVTILSRHTTTAITINEMEGRLVDDTRQFLLKLVPAACKSSNIQETILLSLLLL